MVISKMSAKCKFFNVSVDEFEKKLNFQGLEYGYRADSDNLEFVLIKNFIAIPYSFFNLIYKEEFKEEINSSNFDIDGLNYIIEKRSELHKLVLSYDNLEYVLDRYEKIDIKLLD
jgi:hypothetical protein